MHFLPSDLFLRIMLALAATLGVSASASAQWARVLTTSPDRLQSLELSSVRALSSDTTDAIILNTQSPAQTIDGFGYAITYASCYNLMRMPEAERKALLRKTFSHNDGYGVSYVRISIGCNDFSSDEFSLCDRHDDPSDLLRYFSLSDDDTRYVIPILKEILAINPDLKIIAAPWTPPRWMKYHEENGPEHMYENPQWTGGRLRPDYYGVYGQYFVKFINAMKDNGIRIHAIAPQNEPLNWNNSASLYMPYTDCAAFVKQGLAPALSRAGLDTKIYLYDHNYDYDASKGLNQAHYPIHVYNLLGEGFEGENLVAGACYHNYGGNIADIVDDVVLARPDKELLFTEASIGEWNDGRNLSKRLAYDMDEMVISTTLNSFRGALVWNFMLDTNKAPNRPLGCRTCYGAVDLNANNPSEYTLNSHYYIMAHASDAVKPGARRITTDGWWTSRLSYAAFLNPDGTPAILLANQNNRALNVKVNVDGHTYLLNVPARGVVSARFGETLPGAGVEEVTADATRGEIKYYTTSGQLVANPTEGNIYVTDAGQVMLYH